jgi:hypothetical protein
MLGIQGDRCPRSSREREVFEIETTLFPSTPHLFEKCVNQKDLADKLSLFVDLAPAAT